VVTILTLRGIFFTDTYTKKRKKREQERAVRGEKEESTEKKKKTNFRHLVCFSFYLFLSFSICSYIHLHKQKNPTNEKA